MSTDQPAYPEPSAGDLAEFPSEFLTYEINMPIVVLLLMFLLCHLLLIVGYYSVVAEFFRTIARKYVERYKVNQSDCETDVHAILKQAAEKGLSPLSNDEVPSGSVILYYANKREKNILNSRLGKACFITEPGMEHYDVEPALVADRLEAAIARHGRNIRENIEVANLAARRAQWKRWLEMRLKHRIEQRILFNEQERDAIKTSG